MRRLRYAPGAVSSPTAAPLAVPALPRQLLRAAAVVAVFPLVTPLSGAALFVKRATLLTNGEQGAEHHHKLEGGNVASVVVMPPHRHTERSYKENKTKQNTPLSGLAGTTTTQLTVAGTVGPLDGGPATPPADTPRRLNFEDCRFQM